MFLSILMRREGVVVENHSEFDIFKIFELDKKFDLDMDVLDQRYYSLQQKYHPDKSNESEMSAQITKSYLILKSPLARSQYLLSLEGIIVNSSNNTDTMKTPFDILEQILADGEELSACQNNHKDYFDFKNEKSELKKQTIEDIAQNFTDKDLQSAARNTIYLQYLTKLLENIDKQES